MSTSVPLGIVSLKAEGAYSADKLYKKGMWVTSSGSSYAYINPIPAAGVPLTDTSHWQQIAEKGDTGPSSYDAAVAGGYTGTEADFNEANAGIEAAKDSALEAAETANEAAENAETAAYRTMLWRRTTTNPATVYPVPESPMYAKVSGTPIQEGEGDPSPENIRPITPWLASGATVRVKRTGKNLLDLGGNSAHWTYIGDNTFQSTASYTTLRNYYYLRYLPQIPGVGIVFKFKIKGETGKNPRFRIVYTDATTQSVYPLSDGVNFVEATLVSDTAKTVDYIQFDYSSSDSATCYIKDAQVELGSAATPYEPYSGQEITLTAPQEIPAGWMDNEGGGESGWGYLVLDGSETWSHFTSTGRSQFYFSLPAKHDQDNPEIVSSHYKTGSAAQQPDKSIYTTLQDATGDVRLSINDTSYADVSAWTAYLTAQHAAGTPVTIAYKLATPTPLTLTPAPLTAAPQLDRVTPRQNVLAASTGNIELTYAKSPIREADELAAAIAALS